MLLTQRGNSTAFTVHSDDAPTFYLTGNPLPTDAATRQMETDVDALTVTSPITGNLDKLSVFLADQAEMNLLHMVTSVPDRTPTFTMFGNPDYFNQVASASQGHGTTCSNAPACVVESRAFAWNHGDVQQEITRTWFGMVGPGVKNLGRFDDVFSDHTDLRPTILTLLGLTDDYVVDGRVLSEVLNPANIPPTANTPQFVELAKVYKQINAPVGPLGLASLKYANASITSSDPSAYGNYLTSIAGITTTRNNLTAQMIALLNNAAFANQDINPEQAGNLIAQGNQLLSQVQALAGPGLIATHDFNGDTFSDVLWRDSTGTVSMWLMNGAQILSPGWIGAVPNSWSILGQRDFNGDGKADLLWRDTSGNTAVWFLNGTQVMSSQAVGNIPTTWTIVAAADFNGDGMADILWQDNSGNLSVWLMNGASVISTGGIGNVPAGVASIVGTGDFNGDGKADLLWRDASGNTSIWLMNGTQVFSAVAIGNIPTTWSVAGTGDFNGDGKSDIVWRDNAGDTAVWLMSGATVLLSGSIGNVPLTWSLAETGDYNGDGKSDIMWRDGSGNTAIWFMISQIVSSTANIGGISTTWTVQSVNAE
jgi:hypothetical protein